MLINGDQVGTDILCHQKLRHQPKYRDKSPKQVFTIFKRVETKTAPAVSYMH